MINEKRNRAILRMLVAGGMPDLWTLDGPTQEAQRAFHAGGDFTCSQGVLLRLAFYAWGRPSATTCAIRDLLELDRPTALLATAFIREWCRLTSGGAA